MAEQPQVVSVRIRPPAVGAPSAPTVQPPAPASSSGSPSTPCIVPALSAAVSAGTVAQGFSWCHPAPLPASQLGFVFGFVPATIRTRSFAAWRVWCSEGWRSATALAVMSGLYSWVHCLCLRIRLKDDAWNRAVAGGATGVALGYKAGPASAVQSALGLGLLSYFVDFGGAAEAPPAHARPRSFIMPPPLPLTRHAALVKAAEQGSCAVCQLSRQHTAADSPHRAHAGMGQPASRQPSLAAW
ncbi:mitochondrial import inner membrane translocase subunit [Haematococcus lacustris]|uniref:Mitochondrial import inner membrane translocase subunit n=1 Tax=Haematococcus lacustris TaxID=44745 RepID=A0A699YVD8_HAELA|nr:mitochondrial import inner membrane translocase subunit [Haematococcus lacustris]